MRVGWTISGWRYCTKTSEFEPPAETMTRVSTAESGAAELAVTVNVSAPDGGRFVLDGLTESQDTAGVVEIATPPGQLLLVLLTTKLAEPPRPMMVTVPGEMATEGTQGGTVAVGVAVAVGVFVGDGGTGVGVGVEVARTSVAVGVEVARTGVFVGGTGVRAGVFVGGGDVGWPG